MSPRMRIDTSWGSSSSSSSSLAGRLVPRRGVARGTLYCRSMSWMPSSAFGPHKAVTDARTDGFPCVWIGVDFVLRRVNQRRVDERNEHTLSQPSSLPVNERQVLWRMGLAHTRGEAREPCRIPASSCVQTPSGVQAEAQTD